MRSGGSFRSTLLLLLTVMVLGAAITGLSHGRRVPSAELAMVHEVQSPPGKEHCLKKYRQRSKHGGVHAGDRRILDLSDSKRVVPQGPNPLHN
ncbi:hypothetical protein PR202_ga27337 [Eleusine coracana subsp. coracana]|uniref:Uncharacterized protein n=1 Tax=Eleusine coracana subsp. coracana TaxID=191504 RepID=A0AAV5DGF2_ELECO|nr:hypothetical protein PR202_ga27337 [Eleusine coracana subsp. coracana]